MQNIEIVGMKVMNKQENSIGTIEKVQDSQVYVNFHGKIYKYEYPAAFASFLELENNEVQEIIERLGYSAEFDNFKRRYNFSLANEINYLKSTGGKKYHALDGECLVSKNGEFLYVFDTDTGYHFPDGTPIRIWFLEDVIMAYVVSCEDFSIMIRTLDFIGDKIDTIEFTTEQWLLLEALMERLAEMNPTDNSIAYELACKGRNKTNPMSGIVRGQDAALRRANSERITFIWGPPGTGKTETLSQIALEYIMKGQRVLMLSYSNVSVDGALLRVADKIDYLDGQIIRYGYPRVKRLAESKTLTSFQYVLNKNPELATEYYSLIGEKEKLKKKDIRRKELNDRLNKIRKKLLDMEKELVENATFVATTISKAIVDRAIYSQMFDVVIFDEASMAYVPQIVFSGGLARKCFVCLGDFRQLPAIVQNEKDINLAQDIFEYTGITSAIEKEEGHEWLVMLNKQYRMHKDIADFVSNYMYGGLLQTAEEIIESRVLVAENEPVFGEAISLVDTSGTYSACLKTMDGSRVNLLSALISIVIAESYIEKYKVGIITPYRSQSRLIMAMIRDLQEKDKKYNALTCATVHQFQGSEKPIIIYDAVDCFRMPYPGTLLTKVKNDTANRLFNVAMTRAQGKFILIANNEFLFRKKISKTLLFTKVLNDVKRKNTYLDAEEFIDLYQNSHADKSILISSREDSWEHYLEDISKVKKEVHIDIPGVMDENDDSINELGKIMDNIFDKEVSVSIRADENLFLPSCIRKYRVNYDYVTTPITIIDENVVWFGQPLCAADFISEGEIIPSEFFPCIRFTGRYTIRLLQAIFNI